MCFLNDNVRSVHECLWGVVFENVEHLEYIAIQLSGYRQRYVNKIDQGKVSEMAGYAGSFLLFCLNENKKCCS